MPRAPSSSSCSRFTPSARTTSSHVDKLTGGRLDALLAIAEPVAHDELALCDRQRAGMCGADDGTGFEHAMWLEDMGVDELAHRGVDVARVGEEQRQCPRREGYVDERNTADVWGRIVGQGVEEDLHDTRFVLS